MQKFFLILLCGVWLVGCSNQGDKDDFIDYIAAKEQIINNGAILIDVRTEEEYNEEHIEGAVLLPVDTITEETVHEIVKDLDTPIIVYCQSGNRSQQAAELLSNLGYREVYNLGAMSNWQE